MNRKHRAGLPLLSAALVALLAGCSAPAAGPAHPTNTPGSQAPAQVAMSPLDESALEQIRAIAPTGADETESGDTITATDCWTPSEHLVAGTPTGTVFRVICRVHYTEAGAGDRYQDVICIGDFDASPVLDHCFHWAPYSDMPSFEDGSRLASPPPTPIP